jgi:hypothetical protein
MGFLLLLSLLFSFPAAAQNLPQTCAGSTAAHLTQGLKNTIKTLDVSTDSIITACVALPNYQPVELHWSGQVTSSCLDLNTVVTQPLGSPATIAWSDNTTSDVRLAGTIPLAAIVGTAVYNYNILDGHFAGHQLVATVTLTPAVSQALCVAGLGTIYWTTGPATFTLL